MLPSSTSQPRKAGRTTGATTRIAQMGIASMPGETSAIHSQGDWTESAEGDHSLPRGRSPHLAEARSGFWEGERASEGRGCFERGTLNADRKANRKGATLFNGFPHGNSE